MTIVSELMVACRSDQHRMWDALTDTERLNRALGMSKLTLTPLRDASAARYLVSTQLGGLPVQYEERPFEWIYPRSFRVVRRMRSGPLDELAIAYTLEPRTDGGTDVGVRLTLTPRYGVLAPFLRILNRGTMRNFEHVIREMDEANVRGSAVLPLHQTRVFDEAFRRADVELHGVEADRLPVVDKLLRFVRDGADLDVSRIRPLELADEWAEDRRAVLGVCLSAVRAGLLDLRWEVVCPSCRTATEVLASLSGLSEHGGCQLCDLEFAVDLEDAVEATFAPARSVREIELGPYCIGGPARTPHVVAQTVLPANGEGALVCPDEAGRYRLFVRGGKTAQVDVEEGAPASARSSTAGSAEPLRVAPGGTLTVANATTEELHAKVERLTWVDQAARARLVTSMPGFRRDFSADILRPGTALKVARVGLLFTDLTGSTQLYTSVGDAAAFKLVHDHFDVVIALIEKHGGTLVKTMGDAVMGAFADDLDGLAAAVAIVHAFEDFRRDGEHRDRTHIKLGVYGGPCYVVTANGVLDYFGQTVNVAARMQAEAKSGEIVVEDTLAARAIERRILPEAFVAERYDARLKGVELPVRAARIRLPGGKA